MGVSHVNDDSDQEVSSQHENLLKAVGKLGKGSKWIKKVERFEPTLKVSELNLVKSGITDSDLVREVNLVKPLARKTAHKELQPLATAFTKKVKTLHKPVEKPAAEKLKREVGYKNTQQELRKWEPIIEKNRAAPRLKFPVRQSSITAESTTDTTKRFTVQTELEKALAALEPPKEPEKIEKSKSYDLTLAEILAKNQEAAKFRAQVSYKGAAARRQKKIKSKKYHRLERKAKTKRELKEFEQLQKTDPQAALEKLEQLDRVRAEERMSLRHKSTGQWAKNKQVRAKYDKESRQALAQQLSISRELTMKSRKAEDSSEDEEPEEPAQVSASASDNPWISSVKTSSEIDDFVTGYRKYWDQKNGGKKSAESSVKPTGPSKTATPAPNPVVEVINTDSPSKKSKQKPKTALKPKKVVQKKAGTSKWAVEKTDDSAKAKIPEIDDLFDTMEAKMQKHASKKLRKIKRKLENAPAKPVVEADSDSDVEKSDLSFKKPRLRPEIDEELDETARNNPTAIEESSGLSMNLSDVEDEPSATRKPLEIDPNAFIAVKPKHIKTLLPDEITGDDEDDEDDDEGEDQRAIISEAFADDDVVDEFRRDKEAELKKALPEDVDVRLPGWGSWVGQGIKAPMRKKRRFILKVPKKERRRDENKGNVVIIEDTSKVKHHQVKELPHPFTSVAEYEASIRAPIGRTFVPENAHQRLIAPPITTKLGRIIEPMDETVLLKKQPIKGDEIKTPRKKKVLSTSRKA